MKEKALNLLKILSVIVLFTIPISLITLYSELVIGDELWNFQNITKMINGGKMYVDSNIIITPIFYLIGFCFVKFITGTILGFRIYNIVIFLGLLLSSFYLFRSLKIDNIKSFIYTVLVFLFVMPYISGGASYNVLAETFFILGVVLFLNKDKIKFYNICQGFIIFLCIFTKQNIGVYYFIALVIVEIIIDKKQSIHYIIREMMVASVLSFIAIVIMCITGCFRGFLDYAFLGMSEFASENISIPKVTILYFVIALCSYILGFLLSKEDAEVLYNIKVLSIFSLLLNLLAFPIINFYHATFAILLNIIIYLYIFEKMLLFKLNKKLPLIVIAIILYICINIYSIVCVYKSDKMIKIVDKGNIYFSSNMSKDLNDDLVEVTKYIKQKESEGIDVICLSQDAALYMTYLHKSHGEMDLCFLGNLGYAGKDNIMQKIQNLSSNTEILINKEKNWQEIFELRLYIKKNLKKVGEIRNLEIYKID